jgi:hypothetical protein
MVKKTKAASRSAADQAPAAHPSELLPEETELRVLSLGKPGALLMRLILEEGGRRGLRKEALARESLAIARSYFLDLCSGRKDVPGLGPEAIAQAGRFLHRAPIEIRLLAGQLTPQDFYAGGPETFQDALQSALHTILSDPEYAPFTPPSILRAEADFQSFVVHLYERATGKPLIPAKLTNAEVIKRYQALSRDQDSPAEASTSGTDYDRVLRACRNLGITLRSARLSSGTFVDALGISLHGTAWSTEHRNKTFDIAKAVETFAPELRQLDSIDPQPEIFRTGVIAASLLALSLDPSTLEFFQRLSQTRVKDGSGGLPIRRLLVTINRAKKQEADGTNALREQDLCSMTLQAVDVWKKPDQANVAQELSAKALSGLLARTVDRVRTHKAAQGMR